MMKCLCNLFKGSERFSKYRLEYIANCHVQVVINVSTVFTVFCQKLERNVYVLINIFQILSRPEFKKFYLY